RESSNILTAIGAVNIFVEAGIEKGGVLVHCAGGRSRSAAFVVAFIMSTQGCSYDAAFAKVRRARPVASVNRGFEQQLRAYGAAQCDVFAAHQMMLRIRAATLLDRRNLILLRRGNGCASSEASGGGGGGGVGGEQTKTSPVQSAQPQQQGVTGTGAVAGSVSGTGIPPTPRSPRGRGRSPAGGNPAASYWQRRGSGGGNGSGVVTNGMVVATPTTAAAAAVAAAGKCREDQAQFLPKEPRPTRFRLCRPGSASVQVTPPLKNLERVYACRGCGAFLLTGGHIIKQNVDLPNLQTVLIRSSPRSSPGKQAPDPGASPLSLVTSNSTASNTSCTAASQQQPPPYGGTSVGCPSICSGRTDVATVRGREDRRRSPSPLSERRDQPKVKVTPSVTVSSGSPATRRSAGARRPPPPLRVITTELGPDRPPVHNRWMSEGFIVGVPTGAAPGTPLQVASATVGGGSGMGMAGVATVVAEGVRLQSPLGFTPSPIGWRAKTAGRGSCGATGGGGGGAAWAGDSRRRDGPRNGTAFAFESEDDSSTVDPSERETDGVLAEASHVVPDVFHSGGGGAGCSGWEGMGGFGGGGRLRRGQWKAATGTPPNPALQSGDFNLMLSSRIPLSTGSGMESVSPLMTPRSPRTPASCGSTSPCASDGSFSTSLSRPQSAEKKQFLMRMNQMESRSPLVSGPTTSCLEMESQTERLTSRPAGQWLHVDLLEWMGDIMAAPTGRICCPSTGCGVELGNWSWEKPEAGALKSPTGPPLIRLEKALIKSTSFMRSHLDSRSSLSRDNTPKSSPKSSSASASVPASGTVNSTIITLSSNLAVSASKGSSDTTSAESDLMRRSSGILESRLAGLTASPQ
ncbi:unnamed protein product, partial [Hapterophycus canaliculatus]